MFPFCWQIDLTIVRVVRNIPQICTESPFENIFAFSLDMFENVFQLASDPTQNTQVG